MDSETLTFLLRGGHISLDERIERGLWPHPPLKFKDLVAHLAGVIAKERWFPREWTPHRAGEPVHEGGVIERVSSLRFVYRCRRHHPLNPLVLAEETESVFFRAKAVAAHYLKWDLGLPGDLDGWTVK
jgi:hypothetical protein